MPHQPTFLKVPAPTAPVAVPQVVLTFVNGQVRLGSNITPGPQTWRVIAQICLQGSVAALNELAKEGEQKDGPRIVVPTLHAKGGLAG